MKPAAMKDGKVYSQQPHSGAGDFNFSRADGVQTRINKHGLIETVANNEPRLSYDLVEGKVSDCPHLLLEPSRTNYSIHSQDTSGWTYNEFGGGSSGSIAEGKIDMFGGTNAVQVDFPSDAENVSIRFGHTSSGISSGSAQTSLYIKLVGSDTTDKTIRFRTGGDRQDFTVSGDSFVRYTQTHTKASNEAFNLKLRPSDGTSSGGFSIIICHPQEEAGSYATSYIPTSGSTEQRQSETCNGSGTSAEFNDSEGVLFAEIAALEDDQTNRRITVSDGSNNNRIVTGYNTVSNRIFAFVVASGSTVASFNYNVTDETEFHKVAIKYKNNDFAFWVDGVERDTEPTSGSTPSGLNTLQFEQGSGGALYFYGKAKQLMTFNEALTDEQLQLLTSP